MGREMGMDGVGEDTIAVVEEKDDEEGDDGDESEL